MAAANRYSRFISWIRIVLPLGAMALLSTLFLFASRPDPDRAIPFAEADVAALAREERLGRPRYAGTLEDGRAVALTADQIAPAPGAPDRFDATAITGELELPDGAATLAARRGAVDTATRLVSLREDVRVETTAGERLTTQAADIDLDAQRLTAPGAVELTAPALHITAGAMTADGGTGMIEFTGGVEVRYQP